MRGVCLELVDFEVLDTAALPLPARMAGPAGASALPAYDCCCARVIQYILYEQRIT
jgi:hypothetical protein